MYVPGTIQDMSAGRKTIYVGARDAALWQAAQDYAHDQRMTVSAVLMAALEEYLANRSGDTENP